MIAMAQGDRPAARKHRLRGTIPEAGSREIPFAVHPRVISIHGKENRASSLCFPSPLRAGMNSASSAFTMRLRPATDSGSLVDRLWPRGVLKTALPLTEWIATSPPARGCGNGSATIPPGGKNFVDVTAGNCEIIPGHVAAAWLQAVQKRNVTLLYAAHDTVFNNAVVWRELLEGKNNN